MPKKLATNDISPMRKPPYLPIAGLVAFSAICSVALTRGQSLTPALKDRLMQSRTTAPNIEAPAEAQITEKSLQKLTDELNLLKATNPDSQNVAFLEDLVELKAPSTNFNHLIIERSNPDEGPSLLGDDAVDLTRYNTPGNPQHKFLSGPVLVMKRGQTNYIELENKLREADEPPLMWKDGKQPTGPTDYWKMDGPAHLFSTNLHTHGLHVSPGGKHDNVFLDLSPRSDSQKDNRLYLDYQLPGDHVAGTFWYHAHHHGNVAYQLSNGMAGALIIRGDHDNPKDLESIPLIDKANSIPGVAGNYGRVMLLQQYHLSRTSRRTVNGKDVWVVDPAAVSDRKQIDLDCHRSSIASGILATDEKDVLASNGQVGPKIKIHPGAMERWRFIHAGKEATIDTQWLKYDAPSNQWLPAADNAIEMYEIALDGIPTGDLLSYQNGDPDPQTHLTLYPGYRVDVLLKVNEATVHPGEEYVLISKTEARLLQTKKGSKKKSSVPGAPIAFLEVTEGGKAVAFGDNEKKESRKLLAKWQPAEPAHATTPRQVAFRFNDPIEFGVGEDDSKNPAIDPVDNAKPYAQTGGIEQINLKNGRAEDWAISVSEGQHPFHIHVNPFLVQQTIKGQSKPRWVWKDTLQLFAANDPVHIYFTPKDLAGRSVLHCHILDHEDQGMMKEIFIDSDNPKDFPELSFLKPSNHNSPMPTFIKQDGRRKVLVVFRGVVCSHCIASLRDMARISTHLIDTDVVAVSTQPLPVDANDRIGLPVGAPFLCDTANLADKKLLEAIGIKPSNNTVHAVIVWDKSGKETYRYTGPDPLPDNFEIVYATK